MSATLQEHLRESVLRTALVHLLKNKEKSPERTARNIQELLSKFSHSAEPMPCSYEELVTLVKSLSSEECIREIMNRIA